MERGLIMLSHSMVIGLIIYFIMFYVLKTEQKVSEKRSIFIASLILLYMLLFGHDLPSTTINPNL